MKTIDVASIDTSIQMLERFLDAGEVETLLGALRALRAEPESQACFERLVKSFDELDIRQGAVLTYAPYVGILLSDDPFE